MGKRPLIALLLCSVALLSSCAKTYSGGGYDLSEEQLIQPQTATVALSSSNPTAKEFEQAVYEIIEVKARKISSLPHTSPKTSITCKEPIRLVAGKEVKCKLISPPNPEQRFDDFSVTVLSVAGDEYELSVAATTYWKSLESALG